MGIELLAAGLLRKALYTYGFREVLGRFSKEQMFAAY